MEGDVFFFHCLDSETDLCEWVTWHDWFIDIFVNESAAYIEDESQSRDVTYNTDPSDEKKKTREECERCVKHRWGTETVVDQQVPTCKTSVGN
jgi:hypothetical protein